MKRRGTHATPPVQDRPCRDADRCAVCARSLGHPLGRAVARMARNTVIFAGRPADLFDVLARRDPALMAGLTPARLTRFLSSCGGRIGSFRVIVDRWRGRRWVIVFGGGDPVTERAAEGGRRG